MLQPEGRSEMLVSGCLMMDLKCLTEDCDRLRGCRGLCQSCYLKMAKSVRDGLFTWEKLERLGRCLAAKPRNGEWGFKGIWKDF